jgi:hypothetical protein
MCWSRSIKESTIGAAAGNAYNVTDMASLL